MGTIRQIGDTYYIEFYARGLLYSQIAGPDLAAAQKLLNQTEATIAGGEALTVVRHIDLVVFVEQFIGYIQPEYSAKTVSRFGDLILHFQKFLAKDYPDIKQLSQITPSVIESYKVFLVSSVDNKMVNFSILLLREIMEYGIKIGFLNDNPTVHVRLLPLPVRKNKNTPQRLFIKDLFAKGVGFGKVYKLSKLSDIAKMMYYGDLIPLSRADMAI